MMAMMDAVIGTSAITVIAAAIALAAERAIRRGDPAFWHAVWSAIALASVLGPAVYLMGPTVWLGGPDALSTLSSSWREAIASPLAVAGRAALILYAVGVAFLGLKLLGGVLLVRRLAAHSLAVEGPWLRRLQQILGDAAADCRVHSRVQVPVTVGWRRPIVLLPESWVRWDDDRVRAIVAHERAHARRGDYGWNLVGVLSYTIHWWNPLAWIVARRIRLNAELASDRAASSEVGAPEYAAVLIQSARESLARSSSARVLAPGAATSLDARIQALISGARATRPSPRMAAAAAIITLIVMLTALVVRFAPASAAVFDHGLSGAAAHGAAHAVRHRSH